ncbi:F-box/kelch-repeat protein At3g23880-like [Beta vulgaris subsp. vulgaris]|uniref:F-box/kelch-repeat protein At3g23880-like n=1 Tax=Beta vulgaris subsp. vulgaris TaxID=3555 RepID=UPI0020372EE1|nr:F-box/kelch-repeat protein At3g23880-like [Beta vulgaris subsp. vulgaris]
MNTRRKKQKTSSRACFYALPQELIPEILKRLPIKSLLRFKSISKDWNSLIRDPTFTKSQLQHQLPTPYFSQPNLVIGPHTNLSSFIIDDKSTRNFKGKYVPVSPKFIETNFIEGTEFDILGSCNGIILCIYVRNTCKNLYVWNPTINEYRNIPLPYSSFSSSFSSRNLSRNLLLSGLGYASAINDYKIVFVVKVKSSSTTNICVHVYSLRHNKWSQFDISHVIGPSEIHLYANSMAMEALLFNDALYWVEDSNNEWLLKFDMLNETFERVIDLKSFHNMEACRGSCLNDIKNMSNNVNLRMRELNVENSRLKKTHFVKQKVRVNGKIMILPHLLVTIGYLPMFYSRRTIQVMEDDFCLGVNYVQTLISPNLFCINF